MAFIVEMSYTPHRQHLEIMKGRGHSILETGSSKFIYGRGLA
jgi:hypothetical protein